MSKISLIGAGQIGGTLAHLLGIKELEPILSEDGQAELVKADPRVLDVELLPGPDDVQLCGWAEGNTEPHPKSGVFRKDTDLTRGTGWEYDWGKLHCAGTTAQKRIRTPGQQPLGDGETGFWDNGAQADEVTDDISIFGDGRHVDVIIMDGHMGYDAQEWTCDWQTWDTDGTPRPPGQSRFHQYDWYGELNNYVATIDDDGNALPSGAYVYHPQSSNATFHGNHVAGTVAGQYYGCLLYTSPSPRDATLSRMPGSA